MKPLFSTLVIAGLLGGCRRKPVTDPRSWFIESYDKGTITVQHEGNTYKATCEPKKSLTAEELDEWQTVPDRFSACDTVIGLVGHGVQPLEGRQRDADGRIVVMWNIGETLTLRSWRGDKHPAYARAIAELKRSGELGRRCRCRPTPYLNNVIEQDHRFIKKRIAASLWFRSAEGALRTIEGYEAMHLIRKGQIRWVQKGNVLAQRTFIHNIFGIAE